MFNKIMVPVDLKHVSQLERALSVAANLSKSFSAPVVYVGVTPETPTSLAHNPKEYQAKLEAFAADQAARHGLEATAQGFPSHDPAVDLNDTLLEAVTETGADVVVMASHIPNLADHLWPSHGGQIARRAPVSVFVVR